MCIIHAVHMHECSLYNINVYNKILYMLYTNVYTCNAGNDQVQYRLVLNYTHDHTCLQTPYVQYMYIDSCTMYKHVHECLTYNICILWVLHGLLLNYTYTAVHAFKPHPYKGVATNTFMLVHVYISGSMQVNITCLPTC